MTAPSRPLVDSISINFIASWITSRLSGIAARMGSSFHADDAEKRGKGRILQQQKQQQQQQQQRLLFLKVRPSSWMPNGR
jgi:hypothetical protein